MDHIKLIIIMFVFFCAVVMANVTYGQTYPKCGLYEPYRCVPTYGNKVQCGCGL